MKYYYAGERRQPVGPVGLDDLRGLLAAGTIQEGTWVLEEGATAWTTASSVLGTSAPPPARPAAAAPPAAHPHSHWGVGFGMAVFWFILFFPIGFGLWGQWRKGLVWLGLSFVTFGVAWAVSWVDYWMCWNAQRVRRLERWDWFPPSRG